MTDSIAPASFIRNIAEVDTDDQPLEIGAQLQVDDDGTEHRLVLIGNYGIYIDDVPALLEAIRTAQVELQCVSKEAA